MPYCITTLIVSISLYVFLLAMQELRLLIQNLKEDFYLLGSKNSLEEVPSVEVPEYEEPRYRYDVNAFRQRMQLIKDEDGLYEVPEPKQTTDFTGAEVITEYAEFDIEKYVGRK
jgi:hypothetical protein